METHQSSSGVPQPPRAAVGDAGVLRELLPIALWREDSGGRVVEWSLAAQDLLGHRPEEVLGRLAAPLLVPDANRELADRLTERVQAGETIVGTLPVRHRDGHLVAMEMWIVPATDPEGRPGALLIAVETSEVLRMRENLAAMESLFTQSPIGIALLDPDLRYLRVNDTLARMNGVSAARHVGRRLSEVAPGVNTDALEALMRQVLDSGKAVVDARRVGRTPADPGRDHVWSCSYAPLVDRAERRPLGIIASLVDITESQEAHGEVERARHRFGLLAEAGARIGTTLDLAQTAEEVVTFLVPQLADSADVQMLESFLAPDDSAAATRGLLRRLAVRFPDPTAPTTVLVPGGTYQIPLDSVYEQVVTRGLPTNLYPTDLPALFTEPGSEPLRAYFDEHIGSARLVPLVARGKVLGAVTVTRMRDREPFDAEDRVLIDEVVARAALNIDNARLYTTQREAALTLQRSLTNSALPAVTGLELTGRYLPASVHDVGGDWFDVIPLPAGRTGLVIGDVMGHGIHAAAVMGQLRTAVRTLARFDIAPARLLSSLDAVVADLGEDTMATCVYAVHDPADGGWVIARAGHPPPAVVTPDGTVSFLDGPPGTPLGTGALDFGTETVDLPAGGLLVLYTDGLIEARDRDLDEGMRQLGRALRHPERPLDVLCDGILARLLAAPAQDDVAMLLARTAR
ncbi:MULTISPECIES: SpoIIE family protein phosphatase [unclassified Streptomyces]|uniref:SpoIIE family protein phosphatase n=1 Tax=unclassified Streptomyces TaxID=2593676 RepID=UPI001660A9B9|nr:MULTISPECIES: SpoIIE family protein phosphatase [unclassified Streptomyces]MBD0710322.1 protein phosphatase [Streptomyces sp. CBMA291]MBD0717287.1 protein phosphatase [Streptomyces sp. CBMA370]